MGNRLQWRDGTLNITEMGLLDDYFNAWGWIHAKAQNLPEDVPEIRDRPNDGFNMPIRNYRTYIEETNPKIAAEILTASDPNIVREIDALVEGFNQVVGRNGMTPSLALDYCDRARRLIYGKGIRRLW